MATLRINGTEHRVDVPDDMPLLWVLRDVVGLTGNGAELVTTEMVAFEWLRTAEHPAFKDVLGLVK